MSYSLNKHRTTRISRALNIKKNNTVPIPTTTGTSHRFDRTNVPKSGMILDTEVSQLVTQLHIVQISIWFEKTNQISLIIKKIIR